MKKFGITLVIGLLLAMSVSTAEAQKPYKMSIGAVVGTMEGASFKMFFSDNLAFQADLGFTTSSLRYKYNYHGYSGSGHSTKWFWAIDLNPNLMYQGLIQDWNVGRFQWFAGGGLGLGYVITDVYDFWADDFGAHGYSLNRANFKLGVNAIGGVEFAFKKIPLTTQIDMRPGVGFLFADGWNRTFFNYGVNASVRYTF